MEYTKFIKNVIEKHYAEIVGSKINVNKKYEFILHHAIYHLASQEIFKLFYSSADIKCKSISRILIARLDLANQETKILMKVPVGLY